mmetsp:Transcript_31983/g.54577  ORF Transcript_31983/g.54577 Transcript_31983/m.54577 type:complete len:350 (-) Transcript_31983:83-1132(-)|eukprot:CAMPEP_0183730900 /NCGR_PEP_ID=MMETSP0737-20130205/33799_1 /TAXON_ID=385413 /ORGANISM="Thalassiosira miniscula, Strain CCMP1093" /LENGTH=349 /DNA_ID=CAMNT_0025963491 /DNA_START=46 /DNA_END=1095 /DNA_ORIENTATION=-
MAQSFGFGILSCILIAAAHRGASAFLAPTKSSFMAQHSLHHDVDVILHPPRTHHGRAGRRERRSTASSLNMVATAAIPQISPSDIQTLSSQGYVIIPNFIPPNLVDELRNDVLTLRSQSAFKQAKIGQDSTNELNTNIRIAETCFLGRNRPELTSIAAAGGANSVRDRSSGLYDVLDALCDSLSGLSERDSQVKLDKSLSELLYAYYPTGGFYRRHRDAVPNSASVLRKYSLLLYLNKEDWDPKVDAGQLRIHLDGGGDECPPGVEPKFVDVDPLGGTLVLFKSEMIPHEVLDTNSERFALVGWYNRGVTASDIGNLGEGGGGGDIVRVGMLGVAMALVTFGLVNIIGQ